jgi:proteasome lid subunit RPN8/RPN11
MSNELPVPGLSAPVVRDAVYDHVFGHATHEVGGVLVGTLGEGEAPTVEASIPALEALGERSRLTFTHEAWASIHQCLERDHAGRQIVGWYHSHPGFGIFLSGHDMFIHENFFSDPGHVAFVVDPHAGTEGVFGWRDGAVVLLAEQPTARPGLRSVPDAPALSVSDASPAPEVDELPAPPPE